MNVRLSLIYSMVVSVKRHVDSYMNVNEINMLAFFHVDRCLPLSMYFCVFVGLVVEKLVVTNLKCS